MKRGQIILSWIAGLWTVFVIILGIAAGTEKEVSYFLAICLVALLFSLPVWIVCGLLWITIYHKEKKSN